MRQRCGACGRSRLSAAGGRAGRTVIVIVLLAAAGVAPAQADPLGCRDPGFYWSRGRPVVNLRHLFCGELHDGRPKGFHSTRLRGSATDVVRVDQKREERNGIYSATVTFANGRRKLSTFFPDHCTVSQLVHSIQYAASNPSGQHREWGSIGLSAPAAGAEMFCLDNSGSAFEIRFGVLANGRVNTAFPN
jgi:hypothetical protein